MNPGFILNPKFYFVNNTKALTLCLGGRITCQLVSRLLIRYWLLDNGAVITKLRLVWKGALNLLFALRDPRTPAQSKLLAAVALAYALMPFDLLPDLTPFLGLADDILLVPALMALAARSLPAPVQADAQRRSRALRKKMPWLLGVGVGLTLLAVVGIIWGLLQLTGVI